MNRQEKQAIANALKEYCNEVGGQGAAARKLKEVSDATISHILRNMWENISDEMWRRIAKQIDFYKDWVMADTHALTRLNIFLNDAQQYHEVHAIVHREGGGKSSVAKAYAANNEEVVYIACSEYFNRQTFLRKILEAMGKDNSGTAPEMMTRIVNTIHGQHRPLLILDEGDKLNDTVLSFFISLYNELEDLCGIVIMATDFLRKRIEGGVMRNKKGYKEMYSRMGRRFIELGIGQKEVNEDVFAICEANGLNNKQAILKIISQCDGDYRRVKKLVRNERKKKGGRK